MAERIPDRILFNDIERYLSVYLDLHAVLPCDLAFSLMKIKGFVRAITSNPDREIHPGDSEVLKQIFINEYPVIFKYAHELWDSVDSVLLTHQRMCDCYEDDVKNKKSEKKKKKKILIKMYIEEDDH